MRFTASAETGNEVLRYFPGNLYEAGDKAGYHFLTDPDYDHLPYVDGTPVVSDAFIKTTPSGEESWRTVLVGTEGGGGEGLFALDITDPDNLMPVRPLLLRMLYCGNLPRIISQTSAIPTAGRLLPCSMMVDGRPSPATAMRMMVWMEMELLILYLEGGIDEDDWSGGGRLMIT